MENKKLFGIQILRVLACFAVFVVHFGQRMNLPYSIRFYTDYGQLGVQLFFLISGYLAIKSLSSDSRMLNYYKKRAIKILPLYFFVVVFLSIEEIILAKGVPADNLKLYWARYLFFLNGFVWSKEYIWSNIGATWSIHIFALFYFTIPFLYRFIEFIGRKIKRGTVATLLVFVVFLVAYLKNKYYGGDALKILSSYWYFLLGVAVYYQEQDKREWFLVFLFSLVILGLLAVLRYIYIFGFVFAIVLLAVNKFCNFEMPKMISKTVNILDEYSYSFYLGHAFLFCALIDKRVFNLPIRFFIVTVGTVIVVALLHLCVEKPIQAIFNKKLKSEKV